MPETNTPNLGIFITLEGGEGSGKSTLCKALTEKLKTYGVDAITTREPGGAPLSEHIRTLILDVNHKHQWSPMSEALLMNAARREHLRTTIIPALVVGNWVICDRFMDSTRAYQGRVSTEMLDMLEKQVVTHRPDITFLLDAAPEDLLDRRAQRDGHGATTDRFESRALPFHRHVRQRFLDLAAAQPERIKTLSALTPPQEMLAQALSHLAPHLPPKS